jgi:hypothetical protein
MNNIGSCIMKAFIWVVGFASLGYGIYFLSINTSDWPQIEAVVTSCTEVPSDDLGSHSHTSYYEFEVDSVKYQDSTDGCYDKGKRIKVYYDPDDPSTTVTSQGELGFYGCIGVLFGLFCLGGMAWGAIKARKDVTANRPTTAR